jgi:hypothetical protein
MFSVDDRRDSPSSAVYQVVVLPDAVHLIEAFFSVRPGSVVAAKQPVEARLGSGSRRWVVEEGRRWSVTFDRTTWITSSVDLLTKHTELRGSPECSRVSVGYVDVGSYEETE